MAEVSAGRMGGGNNMRGFVDVNAALASEAFDAFCGASTMRQILGLYQRICSLIGVHATRLPDFYPKLRSKLTANSWRAQAVLKKVDIRANHRVYNGGKACPNTKVLIVGAGPCGLRTAIECQLLGAKVVVIEKRESMSRNNVLHLWPFVIHDLKALGAKKFFGKFCAGSIDHISIRQLQYILLKIALLIGVEFHEGISFEGILEPETSDGTEKMGWRANVIPSDHVVSHYEFDVLIRADGKRDTVEGFKRNCLRAKLAIAITTNFIYRHTEHEASVPEISGISSIFNQKFFKDFHQDTGIDLENIVYYKGDTHYFVMTAKKQSLLEKRVLIKDYTDTKSLLSKENVDQDALMSYAREAANYSTKGLLPNLDFAVNHYGLPDVAIFDFTSMFATENACKTLERGGHRLLVCLTGDSLLEPFWPTGSGCARGFLGSLDAAWAVRSWASGMHPLLVMAERESIYRLLAQTTPENLHRNIVGYTLDPATRYPNLNRTAVAPHQVTMHYDTDDLNAKSAETIKSVINMSSITQPAKKKKRDTLIEPNALLAWLRRQVNLYKLTIDNLAMAMKDGAILCAIINRYRPDLLNYELLDRQDHVTNCDISFQIFEKHFNIPIVLTGQEIMDSESLYMSTVYKYLLQIYYAFKGEIPYIGHQSYDLTEFEKEHRSNKTSINQALNFKSKAMRQLSNDTSLNKRQRKRKSTSPKYGTGPSTEERMQRLLDIQQNRIERQNKRREERQKATLEFYKNLHLFQSGERDPNEPESTDPFEDYSIYMYRQTAPEFQDRVKSLELKLLYPDRERGIGLLSTTKNINHDEFCKRVKSINDKFQGSSTATHKKPKDLMRAIGKIEKTDWNVREIENKIRENKMGKSPAHGGEKVPKWNKEQFLARQSRLQKHGLERQESCEGKFKQIDNSLKNLDKILKDGSALEVGQRGNNKVANLADKFSQISKTSSDKKPFPVMKPLARSKTFTTVEYTPKCHICKKPVYIVERVTSENKNYHKSCFRCHYCLASLRVGLCVTVDDKLYCRQHANIEVLLGRPTHPMGRKITDLDFIDKGATHAITRGVSDTLNTGQRKGSPCEVMDEDEWRDRNFGNSSFYSSSSSSSSSSDDEDIDENYGKDKFNSKTDLMYYDAEETEDDYTDNSDESEYSYHEYSSDDDVRSATECSEERLARELRKQEVALKPAPPAVDDTATDTETPSSDDTEKSSEAANSATEVSTDSEFAHDDPTPTRELPSICINDKFVNVVRGSKCVRTRAKYNNNKAIEKNKDRNIPITKVEIKSGIIDCTNMKKDYPKIVYDNDTTNYTTVIESIQPPTTPKISDYLLSRTQSTSGIASKKALELKKKYLLGAQSPLSIQKSDSASQLDSKFKSFHSNISECQKLLHPASDISPSMQAFLVNTSKRIGPLSPSNPALVSDIECLQYFPNIKNKVNKPDKLDLSSKNLPDVIQNTLSCYTNQTDDPTSDIKLEGLKTPINESNVKPVDNNIDSKSSPVYNIHFTVPKVEEVKEEPKDNKEPCATATETDMDSDSLSGTTSTDEESSKQSSQPIAVPRVEIHNTSGELMQLDSLMIVNGQYIGPINSDEDCEVIQNPVRDLQKSQIVDSIPDKISIVSDNSIANSESGNDITTLALTETEMSDWAVDGAVSDNFDDVEFKINPDKNTQRLKKPKNVPKLKSPTPRKVDGLNHVEHICGKPLSIKDVVDTKQNIALVTDDFDFMDTGSEDSLIETLASVTNKVLLKNRGFMEVIDNPEPQKKTFFPLIADFSCNNETSHILQNREMESPTNDRSINFIEQGACILENVDNDFNVNGINDNLVQDIFQESSDHLVFSVDNSFKLSDDEFLFKNNKVVDTDQSNNTEKYDVSNDISEKFNCHASTEYEYIPETVVNLSGKIDNIVEHHNSPPKLANKDEDVHTPDTFKHYNNFSPQSPSTAKKLLEISIDKVKQKDLIHDLVMDRLASKRLSSSEKRSSRRSRSNVREILNKSEDTLTLDNLNVNKVDFTTNNNITVSENNPIVILDPKLNCDVLKKTNSNCENTINLEQTTSRSSDEKNMIFLPLKKPLTSLHNSFRIKSSALDMKNVHKSAVEISAKSNAPIMFNDNQLPLVAKLNQKGEFILRPRVLSDATDHKTWKTQKLSNSQHNSSDVSHVVTEYRPLAVKDGHGCISKGRRVSSTEEVISHKPANELSLSDPELRSACYMKIQKPTLKDKERRKSIIRTVSSFFNKRLSPKHKEKSKGGEMLSMGPKKSLSECELNAGHTSKRFYKSEPFTNLKRTPSHNIVRPSHSNITEIESFQLNPKFHKVKPHEKNNISSEDIQTCFQNDKMDEILDGNSQEPLLTREEISARIEKTELCIKSLEKSISGLEERISQSSASPNHDEKELLIEWFKQRRRLLAARRVQRDMASRIADMRLQNRHLRLRRRLRHILNGQATNPTVQDSLISENDNTLEESAIITEIVEIKAQRESLATLRSQDKKSGNSVDVKDIERRISTGVLNFKDLQRILPQ